MKWQINNSTYLPGLSFGSLYAAADLGFLVPYFDLAVILLPTPPYMHHHFF